MKAKTPENHVFETFVSAKDILDSIDAKIEENPSESAVYICLDTLSRFGCFNPDGFKVSEYIKYHTGQHNG